MTAREEKGFAVWSISQLPRNLVSLDMGCRKRSILYHFILSEGLSGRGDTLESQPQVSWRDIRSVVQTASWEVGVVQTNKARIGTLGSSLVRLTKQFWTWRGLLNRCPVAIMMLLVEQWQKNSSGVEQRSNYLDMCYLCCYQSITLNNFPSHHSPD